MCNDVENKNNEKKRIGTFYRLIFATDQNMSSVEEVKWTH